MSESSTNTTETLVKGLGGASLGLGLSEILAPAKVAAMAGIDETDRSRPVIRALGLRECAHAAALLFGPSKLVWTRVAGDALDLTLLGAALAKSSNGRRPRGTASAIARPVRIPSGISPPGLTAWPSGSVPPSACW